MSPRLCVAVLLTALAVGACTGDDGGDDGAGLGTTSSIGPPVAPPVPAASPPGTGVVLIGELSSTFQVTSCDLEPDPAAATGELLRLEGSGSRSNGVPFTVEVVRSASDEAAEAFTDLITYTDSARILQVQRSEVAGEVSDLRDPGARGTLLRVRPHGVSATGIGGPPGTAAPEGPGLVGVALDASC
ncbi:MAG: hypothetical protein ACJ739_09960 [Acidimicrobiales bacterium]